LQPRHFSSSTFSLPFSPSLTLSIRLSFSCPLVDKWQKMWLLSRKCVFDIFKLSHHLTKKKKKTLQDPVTHIGIWSWVGQSYRQHESGQKFHTVHSLVRLTLNELELLIAEWCLRLLALCVYIWKWIMSWPVVTGCNMQCLQLRWVETVLPSSVMMGMLDPVVTDAWRTKPCTGLLSGDDLSIPGGVKPLHIQKQRHRLNTSADKTALWIKYADWSANFIADVKVLNLNIYLTQIESCEKESFQFKATLTASAGITASQALLIKSTWWTDHQQVWAPL